MFSIHLEGKKYVVRNTALSTEETENSKGAKGKKVSGHTTQAQAALAIRKLEMAIRKEVRESLA